MWPSGIDDISKTNPRLGGEWMPTGLMSKAVRLAVTVGLLATLLFVVADPREVLAMVADMSLSALVGAVLLSLADRFVMAYKWWLLLRARALTVNLWTAVRSYLASSLYGLVLPVTVGADAVRVLALRHAGMMEVTASIIVERGLGVLAMGSVALLSCLLLASTVTEFEIQSLTLWLGGGVVVMTILFAASLHFAERWANAHESEAPSRLQKAVKAFGHYRRLPRLLTVFYALSVGESLLSAVIGYVVAVGLGASIPFSVFVATVPLALASARLPISLGGFGVQEASFVFLAGLVGVPNTTALSIMLVSDLAMLLALLPSAFDSSMLSLRRQATAATPTPGS